jgi:enoyl-CoA hydratase/carnithine racemase
MRPILFDEAQEGIAVLTINRPEVRNALNWEAMEAFAEAVETAHKKKDLRALIITGKDIAFCAGGDLYELHGYPSRHDGLRLADAMGVTLERLGDLPCPTIAAVEGAALGGGGEVAIACDLRVMAESAFLGLMHIRLAICPAWGGGQRLLRLVGYARAFEWLTGGKILTATEAYQTGVANRIAPDGEALQDALELVQDIVKHDADAVRKIKQFLRAGITCPGEEAARVERENFADLWAAPAHLEASSRFVAKKKGNRQPKRA